LRAAFAAELRRSGCLALDPVEGAWSKRCTLLYARPEMEAEAGRTVEDEVAFEPVVGNAIDVGEAVAQQFSLALPPFPRRPDAALDAETAPTDEAGPLAAALSRLVGGRPR